ncbi:MAG: hypothetical protein KF873_00035 [Gemmataceae bacterium]|nr:hypothetical protein [Planctomycetia bacterium]MBX3397098.1 hypothetical protein [Gemmataceae bacterium]
MNRTVEGVWKDGRIVPDRPVDWPEGQRLRLEPVDVELRGMTEEEQGDDPESIARWIAEMRSIPPIEVTPEEEADWLAWRAKIREMELEIARRTMDGGAK